MVSRRADAAPPGGPTTDVPPIDGCSRASLSLASSLPSRDYDVHMLDPDRLRAFIRTFFGYGSWSAPLWFVGMEEGGGRDLVEIAQRLDLWSGGELEDLRRFSNALEGKRWFDDQPPIQSTWAGLAAVALCAEGRSAGRESIRRYQRDELATVAGRTALIELLPLPSPSTSHWIYEACGLSELSTRAIYRHQFADLRAEEIQKRIDLHGPRVVMFYGLAYRKYWESIAGSTFTSDQTTFVEFCRRGSSLLVLAPHPVARGVRRSDFCEIGRFIRDHLVAPS